LSFPKAHRENEVSVSLLTHRNL